MPPIARRSSRKSRPNLRAEGQSGVSDDASAGQRAGQAAGEVADAARGTRVPTGRPLLPAARSRRERDRRRAGRRVSHSETGDRHADSSRTPRSTVLAIGGLTCVAANPAVALGSGCRSGGRFSRPAAAPAASESGRRHRERRTRCASRSSATPARARDRSSTSARR